MRDAPLVVGAARGPAITTTHGDWRTLLVGMLVLWPAAVLLPATFHTPPALALPAAVVVVVAYLRWALFGPALRRRAARRALVGAWPLGRAWPLALVGAAAAVALVGLVHLLCVRSLPPPLLDGPLDAYAHLGPAHAITVFVIVVVAIPVMHELALRGVLMTALVPRLGVARTLAASAACFAAMHLQLRLLPQLLVAGIALGMLAWSAGSVWASVAAHALWNALALGERVLGVSGEALTASVSEGALVALAAEAAAIFGVIVWRLRGARVGSRAPR
jgi:hypothetical protein